MIIQKEMRFYLNKIKHKQNKTNKITSTGRRGGRSGVRVYKAGRSPDETKRDEMKRSDNERNEKNETRRIFRIAEVACDLQSLDTFFLFTFGRHFGVLARLQKKRPQRRARITSVHFFLAKNRKVLLRFGTIS